MVTAYEATYIDHQYDKPKTVSRQTETRKE